MTHFTVVACTDDPEKIEELMAPFDENLEVAEYRCYEEGEPSGHWWYGHLEQTAKDYAAGTGILPYEPDQAGVSSKYSKETPEQQRVEQAREAALFARLPEPVTWAALAGLHGEEFPDDHYDHLHLDERGRAYTLSSRNPQSKWDYWRIGGRWGGCFPYRDGFAAEVIPAVKGWDSPESFKHQHCDGGPKRALDLEALRLEEAARARKNYREYHVLVDHLPEAKSWSHFRETAEDIDQARALYHAQPRVEAIRSTDFQWFDDPIGSFAKPEELYVELEGRARAVPGYATLTADGRWLAPGTMGWFATSDDTPDSLIGYLEAANAYIEGLDDDMYLVQLDCHI